MFLAEKMRKIREEKYPNKTDYLYVLDRAGLRVSRPTLNSWEKGETEPNFKQLEILAEVLHVKQGDLIQ